VPIQLDRKTLAGARPGELAAVVVGRGRARVERVIGPADHVESALEGLLVERGLRGGYPPLPRVAESGARHDLTGLLTFTIDPETAKDFDDAISVEREGDGVRAWVHIADVSHFVPAGSPLDRAAVERTCSFYVPGTVAPMLPHELADDLCSLRPHVERLCVTVEIPFDPQLEPRAPRFYRSRILSDARLTYGQAERILAGTEPADPPLTEALRLCKHLTAELRRRRFARGAIQVQSPEFAFELDGRGGVVEARREAEPVAHMLVEELMILANEYVAEFLSRKRRPAIYRVHERPDPQSVELLLARLESLDVPTPPAPETLSEAEAERVAARAAETIGSYVRRARRGREAFPSLVLRALQRARYDTRNLGHSGLRSPAYCHFTSPIRRYPDLVVHRALLRELGEGDESAPDDLGEVAERCSEREREAADVEHAADALCLAWLLERRLFEDGWETMFPGEIIGIIESGLFARFGEVFEGYLPARRLGGDFFEHNALSTALSGRRSGRTYRLGDAISVRVQEIRRSEGKVEVSAAT
jgi:ribonuclease R